MNNFLNKGRELLWDLEAAKRYPRRLVYAARYAFVLGRDLLEGQLSMRAMSLVYTTLLSVVPMLALAFSVLKALGAHNALEPMLLEFLRPLGSQANTLTTNVIGFVENIRVGVLGSVGVFLLFYTALSLIQKVESAFNYIWRIERPRPLSQRLGEYFAVLMVGPVAVFSALGLTATVLNSAFVQRVTEIEPFGLLIFVGTKLLPYLLIIAAFTFLYIYVPNTRVRLRAAAAGGLLAGVLWQSGSAIFASFVAGASNYNAIYSSFAILIFLLIWLQLGWLILLVGCQLAFYIQHPEHLKQRRTPASLSARASEYLSLMIMGMVGRRFMRGEAPYTQDQLSLELNAEPEHVSRVIDILIYHGVLAETGRDRAQLIPGIDLDSVELSRLWRLVRAGTTAMPTAPSGEPLGAKVHELLNAADGAFADNAHGTSLRQWLAGMDEKPQP